MTQRSAIVTGASQGIGRSIAMALAREGANVVLASRSLEKLESVRMEIGDCTGEIKCLTLDLADLSSIDHFSATAVEPSARLNILVNCGGMYDRGSISEASTKVFDVLYETNVRGAYALTQSLLPALRKARGDIVFINSAIVNAPGKNVGQFAATQHALQSIANSIRAEVNDDGVRVLSVYPGRTATPRQEAIFEKSEMDYRPQELLQPSDIAKIVVASLNLPATAEVTDLSIRPRRKW